MKRVCLVTVITILGMAALLMTAKGRSSSVAPLEFIKPCSQDAQKQAKRSAELQEIVNADQKDREDFLHWTPLKTALVLRRDLKRRERIGEIFGEGCFKTAADYAAAALVFQHGNVPDQYYQTFLWAKRAIELGDPKQKVLVADGIDRYLVNIGQKQLFGTQAREENGSCFCVQQVESSFPTDERFQYTGKSLDDIYKWVDTLNAGKSCPPARECNEKLKQTPRGSIPGFW